VNRLKSDQQFKSNQEELEGQDRMKNQKGDNGCEGHTGVGWGVHFLSSLCTLPVMISS
jgi:hypothetical protein